MSVKSGRLINFEDQTLFKVVAGESLTVPSVVDADSPTGSSSGLTPDNVFASKRNVVGGMIFCSFDDSAGPSTVDEHVFPLKAGDVVAVAAVASNLADLTINGEKVAEIGDGSSTTVAGVLGYYA